MLNLIKIVIVLFLFLPLIFHVSGVQPGQIEGAVEEKAEVPRFSLTSYRDGDFQKQFETWVLKNFPERSIFLKIYNTINLVLFDNLSAKSRDGLIIGDDDFLFYKRDIYQLAYPHKHDKDKKELEDRINLIKELQDILISKDTKVITLLSPNKVNIYEEKIPNRYKSNKDYFSLYKKYLIEILKHKNLPYIDAAEILKERYKNYPNEALFAKGGYHWSNYGACIVVRSLLAKILKEKKQNNDIPSCVLDHSIEDFTMNDIARIAGVYNNSRFIAYYPNLLIHDINTKIHFKKVVSFGNSFSHQVKDSLAALANIDEFYRFYYETLLESPYHPIDLERIFNNADLVIIEELETGISLGSTANVLKKYIDGLKNK